MKLKIADDLSLPLDLVTQTVAMLAKRRAGKSYTMRRLVEQLFKAGQQVVIVDPKGDQWGIRSAADGKAPGLPIVILGGERGDVPLEAGSGEIVAKLVVEERVSVLLDLSPFRKHEVATFMTAFLENLYRLKAREIYRTPMMLVIDEADAVAPQKPQRGEERMLGAAEDIVRRGGQRGIGCVLVTQRSAVLNKNVLTQAQMLVVLRTIAPQDLAAMDAWIDVHGEAAQRKTLMESLPSLPVGDAWFWSPGWPTTDGIFKRVHVLPIETFDSGASPKPGVKPVEPKHLADVDLDALKGHMAATIEKAKAEDPKLLRAEIARLRAEAAKKPTAAPAVEKRVEVPALKAEIAKRMESVLPKLEKLAKEGAAIDAKLMDHGRAIGEAWKMVEDLCDATMKALQAVAAGSLPRAPVLSFKQPQRQASAAPATAAVRRRTNGSGAGQEGVSRPQQRILNALAWLEGVRIPVADKTQLALLADQSPTSGSYFNNLGALRTAGLINYPGTWKIALTDQGRAAAEPVDVPSSSEELQEQLYRRLPNPQANILRHLVASYPREMAKDALAEATGQSPTSGSYFNNLGRLRTLGLIDYPKTGHAVALPVLFING